MPSPKICFQEYKSHKYYGKQIVTFYREPEKRPKFESKLVIVGLDVILTKKKRAKKMRIDVRRSTNPFFPHKKDLPPREYWGCPLPTKKYHNQLFSEDNYYLPKSDFIINLGRPFYLLSKRNYLFFFYKWGQLRKTRWDRSRILDTNKKTTNHLKRFYSFKNYHSLLHSLSQKDHQSDYLSKNRYAIKFLKGQILFPYTARDNTYKKWNNNFNLKSVSKSKTYSSLKDLKDNTILYELNSYRNLWTRDYKRLIKFYTWKSTPYQYLSGENLFQKLKSFNFTFKPKIKPVDRMQWARFPVKFYARNFFIEIRAARIIWQKGQYFYPLLYFYKLFPKLHCAYGKDCWPREKRQEDFAYFFSLLPISYWSHLQHWVTNLRQRDELRTEDPIYNIFTLSRARRIVTLYDIKKIQQKKGKQKVSTIKKNLHQFKTKIPYHF